MEELMGGKIAGIVPGSIAEEIGIEPGDTLVAINDLSLIHI